MILKIGYALIPTRKQYAIFVILIFTTQYCTGARSSTKRAPSLFIAALECDLATVQHALEQNYLLVDAVHEDPELEIPFRSDPEYLDKRFAATLLTWAARTSKKLTRYEVINSKIIKKIIDDTSVIKYLLEKGAHLDALQNAIGLQGTEYIIYSRPLLVAFQHGNYDIARLLVNHRAWQHEATISTDLIRLGCVDGLREMLTYDMFNHIKVSESSLPLLAVAARYGQVRIADFLVSRNCNVNEQIGVLHHTALHEAAKRLQPSMVRWLVLHGADVNAVKSFGFSALHEVATALKSHDDEKSVIAAQEILKFLIQHDAQDSKSENQPLTACEILAQTTNAVPLCSIIRRPYSLLTLSFRAISRFRNHHDPLFTNSALLQTLPKELWAHFIPEDSNPHTS